jgi:hypothetical protein
MIASSGRKTEEKRIEWVRSSLNITYSDINMCVGEIICFMTNGEES